MRNPVGPLPSSIYWRRRAVLLSVLALLTLVVIWIVASGGGGGKNGTDGANGKDPVQTITPGPSGSGPAISQAPGGRDESGSTDTGGSGSGSGSAGSGSSDGSGSSGGSDGAGASGGGSGSAGTGGGSTGTDDGVNGSVGTGDTLPAGSTLPNCTAGVVQLSLRSVQNTYAPDETPTFQLVAKNSSANDCKIDLGPKAAVVTITQTSSDDDIWSSSDCPKNTAGLLFRVSGGDSITYTFEWDRKASAPECATPKAGSATADTYLVEAQAQGFPKAQTSFVLDKD
ncbi:hypothetical protein STRTUCAR8_04847 [Streptomyces turgidiscabies Car8]|uniref:Uncharacterized protein n=2 Tax=Streptomyces TaxID=1883 RepID=L7F9V1_STRT8|nr:hypothetical protein STRTUCAR8_04847 [Streptomyces turgidiscabies Car8]GAQ75776.1 hypothetical protein T45_07564 [Streptomyces turgidiscabies]